MNYQGYSLRQVFRKTYRKTNLLIKVSIISLLLLSSCYSLQPIPASKFTPDNVLKLKVGMTSTEVIAIFGKPMKTSATTCGSATDNPWSCIIWIYGEFTPRLTFEQGPEDVLYLNSWMM